MERQSSRRRRSILLANGQEKEPVHPQGSIPDASRKSTPSLGVVISSLVVCVLVILAYLHQRNTPDPLQSLFPFPRVHGKNHSILHGSDTVRPRIELHPEDHAYREPSTQYLDWKVTSDYLRPDGVLKRVYLVNGLFPGPTIESRSGDTLVVNVTNDLKDEDIAIHWHGLHIKNSMDGTSGVTQTVIPPGAKFVYHFTIPLDQSGTFWYHAHSGTLRADGLYGGLIVHAPVPKATVRGLLSREAPKYSKQLLLLIGDWYHQPADQVLAWYMRAASDGNEPVSDSLLINGVGHFDCNMAVPARPVDCVASQTDFSFLELDRSVDYRIRVVNTGSLAGFNLTLEREQLELIQLDSVDVEPQYETGINSAGILNPGQRMDFILRSPPEVDARQSSSMTIGLDPECFKFPNPALNPEQSFPINKVSNTDSPAAKPSSINTIDLDQVASSSSVLASLPPKAQQTHVVYTKVQKLSINEYVPYGFFNQSSWQPSDTPLISLPKAKWDKDQLSFSTGPEPVWVDLIVNNLDEGAHPFHLHGHHFYVLIVHKASIGWGSYNPFRDEFPPGLVSHSEGLSDLNPDTPYNISRAVLRDTVQIPSRGYAVLRFRADNPGVWMFHCHILWHLASGMAMLVDVMRG